MVNVNYIDKGASHYIIGNIELSPIVKEMFTRPVCECFFHDLNEKLDADEIDVVK